MKIIHGLENILPCDIFIGVFFEYFGEGHTIDNAKTMQCVVVLIQGTKRSQIARFMEPTWGQPGADRTQVGPMLAQWILLSRVYAKDKFFFVSHHNYNEGYFKIALK